MTAPAGPRGLLRHRFNNNPTLAHLALLVRILVERRYRSICARCFLSTQDEKTGTRSEMRPRTAAPIRDNESLGLSGSVYACTLVAKRGVAEMGARIACVFARTRLSRVRCIDNEKRPEVSVGEERNVMTRVPEPVSQVSSLACTSPGQSHSFNLFVQARSQNSKGSPYMHGGILLPR